MKPSFSLEHQTSTDLLYFSRKPEKTMHLSWILIGFLLQALQILSTHGKHTSHFRTDLTPSTVIQRHFTLYETENDAVSTVSFNKALLTLLILLLK